MSKMYVAKHFKIPKEGITEKFKEGSYGAFSASILDLVLRENNVIKINTVESKKTNIAFDEDIIIENEKHKKMTATIKKQYPCLTWTAEIHVFKKLTTHLESATLVNTNLKHAKADKIKKENKEEEEKKEKISKGEEEL
jgi:hypothetical protein